MVSIDVVIPSYRLLSEYLLAIIQMDVPPEIRVSYIIVADNPKLETPKELLPFINNEKVVLIKNPENYGVCKTRNVGIDNAKAEWVLFLDDDIKPSKNLLVTYVNAVKANPDEVGFLGPVVFPEANTLFQHGIIASDILGVFSLAGKRKEVKWTPTANVIIKRSAIGAIRFNPDFPKNGAGEEVEFFLNIYKNTHKELQCLAGAIVYHNWWYEGKRVYTRFLRWHYGIVLLHKSFPEYTYHSFPNSFETVLMAFPFLAAYGLYAHTVIPFLCLLTGCILGEFSGEFLRLFMSGGLSKSRYAMESMLIKMTNDMGRVGMVLKKFSAGSLCERFDFLCDGKNIRHMRFWAGIKFAGYIAATAVLYCAYRFL
jgi:GT2 family glycosyltransferase